LAVHGLEQFRVRDRDRALVGERCHELDLPALERPDHAPCKPDHAEELALVDHGESKQRPEAFELGAGMGVVRIGLDVWYVNGLLGHCHPPGTGIQPWPIRVQTLILDHFGCLAEVRPHAEDIAVGEIEEARIRPAEPGGCLDDLVENRLEPHPRGA
jgi:hypothetical protein